VSKLDESLPEALYELCDKLESVSEDIAKRLVNAVVLRAEHLGVISPFRVLQMIVESISPDDLARALGLSPDDEIYVIIELKRHAPETPPILRFGIWPLDFYAGVYTLFIRCRDRQSLPFALIIARRRGDRIEPLPAATALAMILHSILRAYRNVVSRARDLGERLADEAREKLESENAEEAAEAEKILMGVSRLDRVLDELDREDIFSYESLYQKPYILARGRARVLLPALIRHFLMLESLYRVLEKRSDLVGLYIEWRRAEHPKIFLVERGHVEELSAERALPVAASLFRHGLMSSSLFTRLYIAATARKLLDYVDRGAHRDEVEPVLERLLSEVDIDFEGARKFNEWLRRNAVRKEAEVKI